MKRSTMLALGLATLVVAFTPPALADHTLFEDNFLHPGGDQRGVGIRLLATGVLTTASNIVRDNRVEGNQSDGIALENADNNQVGRNHSNQNGRGGILANSLSVGNLIEGNQTRRNAEHDCHDDSVGPGTAETANFWIENKGTTENRPGLCRRGADEDDDGDDDDDGGV